MTRKHSSLRPPCLTFGYRTVLPRLVACGILALCLSACGSGQINRSPSPDSGTPDGGSPGSDDPEIPNGPADGVTCVGGDVNVAPDGAGNECSCSSPCSLETGRDRARGLIAGAAGDIVVQLADGTYRLGQTFTLDATDSGPGNGHALIYRAAPDAKPVLSGAIRVQGFAPLDTSNLIWVASVPGGTQSRQLWVNGRRATRARGPDAPQGYTQTATGFTLGDPAIARWPDRAKLEVVGSWEWQMYRCPVSQADASAGLVLAEPCWTLGHAKHFSSVAWLENALELLDSPGEFFLDGDAGKLYYAPRPGEDLASADVELPVLGALLSAAGTKAAPLCDIAFEGLTFAYATWLGPSTADGYISEQATITQRGSPLAAEKPLAAVTMHATHGARFSSCAFSHLGGAGLAFEVGAQGNLVDACRFADISASAILIGDVTHTEDHHPGDPTLIVQDNTVQSSYVTRAGVEYHDAPGIFVGYTTHTIIANNELFDLPYTGISVGWGWGSVDPGGSGGFTTPSSSQRNEIKSNRISHHMRVLRDGGGIYALGAQPGSIMTGNFVSNQGNPYGNLYLDNGSQHWTVTGNLVLIHPKEVAEPPHNIWLYVQVYNPIATNNSISANFTNNATLLHPESIDPSNTISSTTVLSPGDLSPAAGILSSAGTPLRSPEVAQGKPVTASSEWDATCHATAANDGSAFGGWSPAGSDTNPWWQVDLGNEMSIDAIEVVSRWDIDQPVTRRSYRVLASSDPTFATSTVLSEMDAVGLPHRAIFAQEVSPPVQARYVRVAKTAPEYFFLGEVRVHARR